MARRTDPKPWGFTAEAWQGFTFLLAGILALTNAAWFYTVRVVRAEAAAATPAPEPRRVERVVYQTADGHQVPAPSPAPVSREPTPAALASDEQCIGGVRFRIRGDAWTNVGPC